MKTNTNYNGYANRETWNVALWIGNDEGLYRLALQFMGERSKKGKGIYKSFIEFADLKDKTTLDNIFFDHPSINYIQMDAFLRELTN